MTCKNRSFEKHYYFQHDTGNIGGGGGNRTQTSSRTLVTYHKTLQILVLNENSHITSEWVSQKQLLKQLLIEAKITSFTEYTQVRFPLRESN